MTENPSGLFLQDLFSTVAGFLAEDVLLINLVISEMYGV